MSETRSDLSGIYRFTSIGRPVDPAYLTNRVLLIVLPLAGLLSAGVAAVQDLGIGPLSAAFSGRVTSGSDHARSLF